MTYIAKTITNELLMIGTKSYKDRCLEMIANEKAAFKELSGLKLTSLMIATVTGISESTIQHIGSYNEAVCKKLYSKLKRADYYSWISKTLKNAKKK